MGNYRFTKMFKLASTLAVAAAATGVTNMVDLDECTLEDYDPSTYAMFSMLNKEVDCHDSCVVVYTHMFTKGDLNGDLNLDSCEHLKICLGMGYPVEDCLEKVE